MRDVNGLYLAGEYLFLIASTEGALAVIYTKSVPESY